MPDLDPLTQNQANRAAKYLDEKRIASIAIGPGRRTLHACNELTEKKAGFKPKWIVTNSVNIRTCFSERTSTVIWIVGGKFDRDSMSLVPDVGRNAFSELDVTCQAALFGVEGITVDKDDVIKLYVPDRVEGPTLQGLVSSATSEVIVMVHRSVIRKDGVAGFPVPYTWDTFRNKKLTIITNEVDPADPDSSDTTEVLTKLSERGGFLLEAPRE